MIGDLGGDGGAVGEEAGRRGGGGGGRVNVRRGGGGGGTRFAPVESVRSITGAGRGGGVEEGGV
jgi:hypothetical protein